MDEEEPQIIGGLQGAVNPDDPSTWPSDDAKADGMLGERILNQDEIDSLLGFDLGGDDGAGRSGIRAIINSALVSYERLPMLEIVFDRLVRLMTTSLRNFTSDNVEVSLDNISSIRFGDYLNSIPLPAILAVFRAEELDNYGLLTVDSNLIYSIVDVLLGGRRGTAALRIEGRPYTTIERVLVQRMVEGLRCRGLDVDLFAAAGSQGHRRDLEFPGVDWSGHEHGARDEEDGQSVTASAWQGFALGSDGFLTLSAEYTNREPTNRADYDPRPAANGAITARFGDPECQVLMMRLGAQALDLIHACAEGRLADMDGSVEGVVGGAGFEPATPAV